MDAIEALFEKKLTLKVNVTAKTSNFILRVESM